MQQTALRYTTDLHVRENEMRRFDCRRNFWGESNERLLSKEDFETCSTICGEYDVAWDCFDIDGDPIPFESAGKPADTAECDHDYQPTHDDHMNLIGQCTKCEQVR